MKSYGYSREDALRALTICHEIRRLEATGIGGVAAARELTQRVLDRRYAIVMCCVQSICALGCSCASFRHPPLSVFVSAVFSVGVVCYNMGGTARLSFLVLCVFLYVCSGCAAFPMTRREARECERSFRASILVFISSSHIRARLCVYSRGGRGKGPREQA